MEMRSEYSMESRWDPLKERKTEWTKEMTMAPQTVQYWASMSVPCSENLMVLRMERTTAATMAQLSAASAVACLTAVR